jgi:hypothetical protein
MSSREAIDHDLVTLLAHVYRAIDWRRLSVRSPWDVWNHRVRHCATRRTVGEFVSRLANHFGLQHVPPEAIPLIEALEPHAAEALDLVYREHIPMAMRAVLAAKRLRHRRSPDLTLFAQEEVPE